MQHIESLPSPCWYKVGRPASQFMRWQHTVMSGGCSGSAHPDTLVHGCRTVTVVVHSLPSAVCRVRMCACGWAGHADCGCVQLTGGHAAPMRQLHQPASMAPEQLTHDVYDLSCAPGECGGCWRKVQRPRSPQVCQGCAGTESPAVSAHQAQGQSPVCPKAIAVSCQCLQKCGQMLQTARLTQMHRPACLCSRVSHDQTCRRLPYLSPCNAGHTTLVSRQ